MTATLKRMIHVACRDLGLDADMRHDLQLVTTGKASMADMSEADLRRMVDALKARGFKPSAGARPRRARAQRPDVRYIHVLWRLLVEAGAAHQPGPAGLNAFIRARFGKAWGAVPIDVDALTDHGRINTVIKALQAWCDREGIPCRQERRG